MFFFFQAEDGIRDGRVTGVQTCALPISEEIAITRNASEALEIVQFGLDLKAGDEVITTNQDYPRMIASWLQRERRDGRSEERRVGKECRCRWWPEARTKKERREVSW